MAAVTESETTLPPPTVPGAAWWALVAYCLIAMGSSIGGNLRFVLGLPLTLFGFGAVCFAGRCLRQPRSVMPLPSMYFLLSAMAAIGLAAPSPHGTLWYEVVYRTHPAVALATIGIFAGGTLRWRRRALWTTVATAVAAQILAPVGLPHPNIDVWNWIDACARALLHGVHPYTVHAPDPLHGAFDFGSTPTVYPYMPLTLLAAAPAILVTGDYRFALALCLPATIALMRAAGRRL